MKNLLVGIVILSLLWLGYTAFTSIGKDGLVGGSDYQYVAPTMATSSVGIYAWTSVLSADSSRGYVSFCNDSRITNSAIYLGFGATSTVSGLGMYGISVPSNTCYEMTLDKMFYGNVYAIASSATSTLLKLYK